MRKELVDADVDLDELDRLARNKAEAKEIATICPKIMNRAALPRSSGCREPTKIDAVSITSEV
jgi:hypothetical protein